MQERLSNMGEAIREEESEVMRERKKERGGEEKTREVN